MTDLEHIVCPLCGADDTKLVFKRKDLRYLVSETEFPVVRCRHCGIVYVNPRPTEKEIASYYPVDFYVDHLDSDQALLLKYSYVKEIPTGRLLDVGCYKGEFIAFMQEKGWNVHGVESSSQPINLYDLDIFYGALRSAKFPSNYFDLVTMWAVLEHVYNPIDLLCEIQRILKPNGHLVVAVPNFNSLPAVFMRHDDVPRHTTMFTKNTLKKVFSSSGLKLAKVDFNSDLYGGKNRGVINYLTKLAFGEKIEDILAQNRSVERWYQFSSYLNGRKSNLMSKIDNLDITVTPYLDRWLDRFGFGFIIIAKASNHT